MAIRKQCPVCIKQGKRRATFPMDSKFKSNWLDHIHSHGLKCPHDNVQIIQACCTTVGESGNIECGCAGLDRIYCEDCDNQDMTEEEALFAPVFNRSNSHA